MMEGLMKGFFWGGTMFMMVSLGGLIERNFGESGRDSIQLKCQRVVVNGESVDTYQYLLCERPEDK